MYICGERGSPTDDLLQYHNVPKCRICLNLHFYAVLYNATQYHICPEKSCTFSCTWFLGAFFVYIVINH